MIPVLCLCILALAGQSMAQSNHLDSEIIWLGAISWVALTIILAGAAFAFLATDWQLWLNRETQKRWLAGAISIGMFTFIAVGLGCAGIILGWSHLQQAKRQYPSKDIQSMYSSALALYLATYGFLLFYGFAFFNRKSMGWGGVFWALAVISAVACLVLLWWINVTGFGVFFFFPVWLFIFGIIMFVTFSKNREYICKEQVKKVYHTSQYSSVSRGPYGESAVSASKTAACTQYDEGLNRVNF